MEIFYGLISGIITSLGMGGGTILILLLNAFQNIDMHMAKGINLLFYIPTALCSIYYFYKEKIIDYKVSRNIIVSGIIGSILGSVLSFKFKSNVIKKIFGLFILFIAIYEVYLFFKNKKDN